MKRILSFLSLLVLCISLTVYASNSFIVRNIQIRGLQGISRATVLSYVPVRIGDRIDSKKTTQIINSLFKTGFFSNVTLDRRNNTLIINIHQRPVIGQITITGNKLIPTDKLKENLKKIGFTEGQTFDQSTLTKIKASLVRQYFMVGKYNARVTTQIKLQKRNRAAIHIIISEGKTAKIHSIKIIGNHLFSESTLLHQIKLAPSNLLSFFTKSDQYSPDKLSADLESLRSYYMNKGYIKFNVISSQVSLTPDRKHVYITIRIHEGGQYRISGFTITGKTIISKSRITNLIQKEIKKGAVFSRKNLIQTYKNISSVLGVKGYANASVNAIPTINDHNHTVFLTFVIKPGQRIYVRRITFSGNYRTNDEVLRRELRQMEAGLLSSQNIDESKRNLLNLAYVQNVEVTTTPVPNKPNQVDLNYKITGRSPATIGGGIGYSQINHFSLNANVTHKNVLGTGNWLSLNGYYSHPLISLDLTYYNPYITPSHIGRNIHVYASKFDANKANVTDYATDTYGISIIYDFPLSEHQTFSFGGGVEHDVLDLGSNPPTESLTFRNKYGKYFTQGQINASWAFRNFDRWLFPTSGSMLSASSILAVPLSSKSLEFYKIDIGGTFYQPLYNQFIGKLSANAGYGNGYGKYNTLPFFKNYYAGGFDTVRGFEGNSLGPKDSNGDALGGKFIYYGIAVLYFPNPFGQSLRTGLFVNGGNVNNRISMNNIRYSTGLEVDWRSPMGVLNFAFSKALNARPGDDTDVFDFTIGTNI
ncbi:MAG: outer membrane protein assembly factor BamA [Gammaproteobacteria bacterium]|jgi:outer membrane protein insertion porin family